MTATTPFSETFTHDTTTLLNLAGNLLSQSLGFVGHELEKRKVQGPGHGVTHDPYYDNYAAAALTQTYRQVEAKGHLARIKIDKNDGKTDLLVAYAKESNRHALVYNAAQLLLGTDEPMTPEQIREAIDTRYTELTGRNLKADMIVASAQGIGATVAV